MSRRTIAPETPVLCLLGTSGIVPAWKDRRQSAGHRLIPLVDNAAVQSIPMVARLLADLGVAWADLQLESFPTREMMGGQNRAFYVQDAQEARDERGRLIISNAPFVREHGVRTVFGMGGAYLDGSIAIAILFTSEDIERTAVDRFASLVSTYKMITERNVKEQRIFV